MFLEVSDSGRRYHDRLHDRGPGKDEDSSMDELILTWFITQGPEDDDELMMEKIGHFPEGEKDRFKRGVRRLYQQRYLEEV